MTSSVDRILVDVDTQHDFMDKTGALHVPGAEEIVPNLTRLFDFARATGTFVMSSADCHTPDDPEFEQFPPHCVEGTAGQAKLPQTLLPRHRIVRATESIEDPAELPRVYDQVVFNKAAFDVFTNPAAGNLVAALDVGEYVAFGVATDYCVRASVLGLLGRGRRVAVVKDAIRAVAEQTGRAAVDEMTAGGARWVTTDEVVGGSG